MSNIVGVIHFSIHPSLRTLLELIDTQPPSRRSSMGRPIQNERRSERSSVTKCVECSSKNFHCRVPRIIQKKLSTALRPASVNKATLEPSGRSPANRVAQASNRSESATRKLLKRVWAMVSACRTKALARFTACQMSSVDSLSGSISTATATTSSGKYSVAVASPCDLFGSTAAVLSSTPPGANQAVSEGRTTADASRKREGSWNRGWGFS
jgi:hypothetical protein